MNSSDNARLFHALHQEGLLVLPNAWDAGSARVIEEAGAKAIATSSAALAWSHGYPDGEAIPADMLIAAVREIVRVVRMPVSVDSEAGYATDPAAAGAFAVRLIEAGAVGINIEDGRESPDLLCAKIDQIRKATARTGVELWINARIDVYLHKLMEGQAAYDETVTRARRYAEAGASSIFAPGVFEEAAIENLVRDVGLPLNLLAWPGLPEAAKLEALGVRRLSAGSSLAKAVLGRVKGLAEKFLRDGGFSLFAEHPLATTNINALMKRD